MTFTVIYETSMFIDKHNKPMKRTCEFHPANELTKERLCNQKVVSNLKIIFG